VSGRRRPGHFSTMWPSKWPVLTRTGVTEQRVWHLSIESGIALRSASTVITVSVPGPRSKELRCQPSCPTNANLRAQARWNCQVAAVRDAKLGALSQLANPQVGAGDTSATDMVVVPAAQELATWVETNRRPAVSGQVANRQVSGMKTGQTKGDLTIRAGGWTAGGGVTWKPCSPRARGSG
jgi:hypothetical protein